MRAKLVQDFEASQGLFVEEARLSLGLVDGFHQGTTALLPTFPSLSPSYEYIIRKRNRLDQAL